MTGGTVINDRFDVIRASKYWGQIIKLFCKLSKTSRKGSLELQEVENCTTVACIELTESTW